ncbi:MAG: YeeE/YedE family protein, partial [Proteobacteria bacterium]|nr:YeeE/YedE family protein [Pseudomonadota bacterium]
TPLLDAQFHIPTRKDIDWRLLAGAAIFGLGWGWAGICPGPSFVAAASGDMNILWFIASMLGGMALFKAVESKIV